MIVKSTVLKEKKIDVNQLVPAEKMRIKVERTNKMPEIVDSEKIQSELKLEINILDEKNTVLVNIVIAYVVMSVLEDGENYDKDKAAEEIFSFLKSMILSAANDFIKETSYPPLPLNINC